MDRHHNFPSKNRARKEVATTRENQGLRGKLKNQKGQVRIAVAPSAQDPIHFFRPHRTQGSHRTQSSRCTCTMRDTQSITSTQSTALNSVLSAPTIDTLDGSSILRKQSYMYFSEDTEVEDSDGSTSESPSPQTPLTPYRSRTPPSLYRSDSLVTQSSEPSRRIHDTESTESSQRVYATHHTKDTNNGFKGVTATATTLYQRYRTLVVSHRMRKQACVDPPQEKVDTSERLEAIRQEMVKHQLDYYVVPSEDAHGSEFVSHWDKRREFISGGSAGDAIISKRAAYLVVDPRFWDQAERELDTALWTIIRTGGPDGPKDWVEWLMGRIKATRLGIDAGLLSHEKSVAINSKIIAVDSQMIYPSQNLVDLVWKNRPAESEASVFKQEIEYAGQDTRQKIERVRQWIREQRPSQASNEQGPPTAAQKHVATLISSLPGIAWVLNLRGSDIPYNPLFHAYLYIGLDNAIVFLNESKVDELVAGYLQEVGVERRDLADVWNFLREREWGEGKILLPPQISYAISSRVTQLRYTIAPPFVEDLMAVKNMAEISGLKSAYIRDGAAFVQFLVWLETRLQKVHVTEWEAANQLTEFRRKQRNFMDLAYETISASGPNAALPHYTPLKSNARVIDRDTPYLINSGGQYLEGTCDTARTVHFGQPTAEQCEAYTRVLQGHIAIDTVTFPADTSGYQLDVLARKALWEVGMNYSHETGHGVGSYLTVHEGLHGFWRHFPFAPGHVITNGAGYYKKNAWGIRIGSTLLVYCMEPRHARVGEVWLRFERLTCVPIQKRMVDKALLTEREKAWLKEHNQRCYDTLVAHLKDDKRALKWLKREAKD